MNYQNQSVSSSGNTISIELLRTGTPHNQTLSPGVTYLALCGPHPPAEFRINLEQYKFSRYLKLLRYEEGMKSSSIQLSKEALQDIITKIFEDIPALQTEASSSDGWLHLRLVMTPRELAMLPFELALTPSGFQGARDKPFLLNPQRLTTITRAVRQVAPRRYEWPTRPRILFAWAAPESKDVKNMSPNDPGSVPAEEHEEKLQVALNALVCLDKNKTEAEADYNSLLTVLPQASLSKLRAAIEEAVHQKNPYTHIHLLAHGTPIPDPDNGPRYALALHTDVKPTDFADVKKTDAVDGDRLTDALLVVENDTLYSPTVITIAACDGGNEGTNLVPGGSLAHLLHQSGVPYVLASQFPLSKDGSVRLVEDFYPRLLHGEDPRTALYFARKAVDRPDIHDWASLVAYARFPDDFDDQLEDVQLKIAFEIMKAATTWSDYPLKPAIEDELCERIEGKLKTAIQKLENLLDRNKTIDKNPARMAEHLGLLGSAHKRLAEHLYKYRERAGAVVDDCLKRSRKDLEKARGYYQRGHDLLLSHHWTAVQYLSLTAILKGTLEDEYERWCLTMFTAKQDLQQSTGQKQAWACGTLVELYLLKPLTASPDKFETEMENAIEKVMPYIAKLGKSDFTDVKASTARQLERYVNWWPDAFPSSATMLMRQITEPLVLHLTGAKE